MRVLEIVRGAAKRRLVLCLVSAICGGAAALLIVGVPKLWSAEGAGWAAAIATSAAAGIALWLGYTGIQASRRTESTSTLALAILCKPWAERYETELRDFRGWLGESPEDAFPAELEADENRRRDFARKTQSLGAPSIATFIGTWSGAAPSFLRTALELVAQMHTIAHYGSIPLRENRDPYTSLAWGVDFMRDFMPLLDEADRKITTLKRECEAIITA